MQYWTPDKIWEGEECYIIGGGPSLSDFKYWEALKDQNTIGCNGAFELGSEICNIVFFADGKFWKEYQDELAKFDGLVVTNHAHFQRLSLDLPEWLKVMKRVARFVGTEDTIAFNTNSGASAINLALILGASTVYLLGYDLKKRDGKNNWHDLGLDNPSDSRYQRFLHGFSYLKQGIDEKFPEAKIINVTDDSDLDLFPKEGVDEHFSKLELFGFEESIEEETRFDVMDEFPEAKRKNVRIYKKGRWFNAYDAETGDELHEKGKSEDDMRLFLQDLPVVFHQNDFMGENDEESLQE